MQITKNHLNYIQMLVSDLGAVLYQKQDDDTEHVIVYASRTLSKSERNYDTHKLEFLALKWSNTERFHEYLYGGHFEVYADNNPLTCILTTAKLDTTGQRWVASLANYKYTSRSYGTFHCENNAAVKIGVKNKSPK